MDDVPLNTDSFVDIIANTVGILIILALMPIMLAKQKTDSIHLDDLTEKIKKVKKSLADSVTVRSAAENRHTKIEAKRSQLDGDLAQAATEKVGLAVSLSKLRSDERRDKSERDQDRKAAERALAGLPAADKRQVRTLSLDALRARKKRVRSEADALAKENARLETRRRALQKQLLEDTAARRALKTAVTKLANRNLATVTLRDPLQPRAYTRKPVWFECYRPAKSLDADGVLRGCVRLLSPDNYEREGMRLRPKRPGETTAVIAGAGSAFRRYLADHVGEFRKKHYVYFVVRPEAYAAFRAARVLARTSGWRVAWDPIPAGEDIVLGRASP